MAEKRRAASPLNPPGPGFSTEPGPGDAAAFVAARLRRGWCRGASWRDERGVIVRRPEDATHASAWGALEEAARAGVLSPARQRSALRALDARALPHRRFTRWHDDPARTLGEVLAELTLVLGDPTP